MVMRSSSQSISKGGGWKGILMMVFLTAISVLSLNIFGQTVSFVFLPLIGICLWPRTERVVISIIAILFFGLLLDLLWAGPLGLWALIFLTTFALFRPHLRPKPHSFSSAFLQWLGVRLLDLIFWDGLPVKVVRQFGHFFIKLWRQRFCFLASMECAI